MFLDNNYQGYISLYDKKELTKSILIVKFNPQKYLKLLKIKSTQKRLFFKRYLVVLFKNTKKIKIKGFSFRKLKWQKKTSIFIDNIYSFVKRKHYFCCFISDNGFLLYHTKPKISKKVFPGIYFLLEREAKIYFKEVSILLYLLLRFFGRVFVQHIKNSVKLFSTTFVYFKYYLFLSTEIKLSIKRSKVKFRKKKNKIMYRYSKFFNRTFNRIFIYLLKIFEKRFLASNLYNIEIPWSSWLFYSIGFNRTVIFTDDMDDNKKILSIIKPYSTYSKINLFKQIIYLLQLNWLTKQDVTKLQIDENYYDLKASLFHQFLHNVWRKNLFQIKTSYFYFFSSDLYLLSCFKYYQLEYIFSMHHNRIVKNIASPRINEFINFANFSWKIISNKTTKLPGLAVMQQFYYRRKKLYKRRLIKKNWLKSILIYNKNNN